MKFRVMGSNRDTGARMILEFEAESKAAAERKATQAGMSVNHVQDISNGHVATAAEPRRTSTGRGTSGGFPVGKVVLLVAIAAAVLYFWPKIRELMNQYL